MLKTNYESKIKTKTECMKWNLSDVKRRIENIVRQKKCS